MTTPAPGVGATFAGLADLLATHGGWSAPSLCAGWSVAHVVAHVTMPVAMTPEEFGAVLAAAGGDFTAVSDAVAARDAALPAADLLARLRSPQLHAWQPPGGGPEGARSHAVVHSLDVTVALGRPAAAPSDTLAAVRDELVAADGAVFGLDLTGIRLVATDDGWAAGAGRTVAADRAALVALLAGRTLPDGRSLPRVGGAGSGPQGAPVPG